MKKLTDAQILLLSESLERYCRRFGGRDCLTEEEAEIYDFLELERKRIVDQKLLEEWTKPGAYCTYYAESDLPF